MELCLVPDFPAVLLVLEHLTDLDRQLKEDGVPFASEASVLLAAITDAVSELEAQRRAAHEHLEVETIENANLRHQIKTLSDRMKREMLAALAAVRESSAKEMERLRQDRSLVSRLHEEAGEKLQALLNQNKKLHPEREQVKVEHEAAIAELNARIDLKYRLQAQLDQKLQEAEELKLSLAALQQERTSLKQHMASEREACSKKKDSLTQEMDETVQKIQQQDKVIAERRQELDRVNSKKDEALGRKGDLRDRMDKLESVLKTLETSRMRREQKLEEEAQRNKKLGEHLERQEKESRKLKEALAATVRNLQEQMASVGKKTEEDQTSGVFLKKSLSQMCEALRRRIDEENEVRAEHVTVSEQLELSRLQLEECIASIVVHSKEIRKMEKEIEELQDTVSRTKRVFEKNREELQRDMDATKRKINKYQEDEMEFRRLLEEAKVQHEEQVDKTRYDIVHTKEKHENLLQEEAELLQKYPKCADFNFMMSYISQTEMENRRTESDFQREVQRISAEIQSIHRSTEEKQKELEERGETLKELEATWTELKNGHDRLSSELRWQQTELELSIQNTESQTEFLLGQEKDLKAELQELQERHTDTLDQWSSELRVVEVSVCNHSVLLKQVRAENSRLLLYFRQLQATRGATEQYQLEDRELRPETEDMIESLREAWRQDVAVTREYESRDGVLLASMNSLQNRLRARAKLLMIVGTVLHHKMMHFSKRVGLQATAKQQV